MLIAGSVIWGTLMLIMGSVNSYLSMLLSRICLDIAEGPQFSWILKIISRWFPRGEHGRANTMWLAGSPLGSAIGFPLIIALVAAFGWRTAFLFACSALLARPLGDGSDATFYLGNASRAAEVFPTKPVVTERGT